MDPKTPHSQNTRMIALLRGINVGGHTVSMERLRSLFTELGLQNVKSYIQTGNIFFDTPATNMVELRTRIENHLKTTLGYDVPTFLRTVPEFEAILALNPFRALTITTDMRCCVMFTADRLPGVARLPLVSPKGDLEIIYETNFEAFVIWHIINGRPPSSTAFLAGHVGKVTTTRFFHTAEKILAAAKS